MLTWLRSWPPQLSIVRYSLLYNQQVGISAWFEYTILWFNSYLLDKWVYIDLYGMLTDSFMYVFPKDCYYLMCSYTYILPIRYRGI